MNYIPVGTRLNHGKLSTSLIPSDWQFQQLAIDLMGRINVGLDVAFDMQMSYHLRSEFEETRTAVDSVAQSAKKKTCEEYGS